MYPSLQFYNYISTYYSIIEIIYINDIIILRVEKIPLRSGERLYMIKPIKSNRFIENG